MTELRTYIFDLDGVLVDTAFHHFKAWKKLAGTLGIDFTAQQNESLKGISRMESLKLILGWGGLSLPEEKMKELADRKNEWYIDMLSTMSASDILPGVTKLLAALRESGIKTALGSVSRNAAFILERTGLSVYFDVVVDGCTVAASKPDPTVFLTAASLLGEKPENCLVFEDAVSGIRAARAAGMRVIGVGNAAVLEESDLVIPNFSTLTLNDIHKLYLSTSLKNNTPI
ncbi:MAG: beta-phosphoglucomutase [Agriterribacter sp.]